MSKKFVAINYIHCADWYKERFEYLFSTRAQAIDTMPGFIQMHVLKPAKQDDAYLIVSYWQSEEQFRAWTKSEAYIKGHARGFEDIAKAHEEGKPVPMSSIFKCYEVMAE